MNADNTTARKQLVYFNAENVSKTVVFLNHPTKTLIKNIAYRVDGSARSKSRFSLADDCTIARLHVDMS